MHASCGPVVMCYMMRHEAARELHGRWLPFRSGGGGIETGQRPASEKVQLLLSRFAQGARHVDVSLRAIDDTDVTEAQVRHVARRAGQNLGRVGPFIHQVELREHAEREHAIGVGALGDLDGVAVREVGVGGRHSEHDRVGPRGVGVDHRRDLLADVRRLVTDRILRDAGQVDERQVGHVGRVEAQVDRSRVEALVVAAHPPRVGVDLATDLLGSRAGKMDGGLGAGLDGGRFLGGFERQGGRWQVFQRPWHTCSSVRSCSPGLWRNSANSSEGC